MRQEYKEALDWLRSCERDQLAASDDPASSYVASQLGLVTELLRGCAVDPIPLSERKPGRGDCDDQGRCWSFDPLSWTHNELVTDPHDREHRFVREVDGPSWELRPPESGDTHWLPASVQFLPARVEE